jgi:hypothetical protein
VIEEGNVTKCQLRVTERDDCHKKTSAELKRADACR